MEEVRSYWQVAGIQHFCTLFQKPFKLPSFEPEELEQAFIIDIPEPPRSNSTPSFSNNNIHNHNSAISNSNEDGDGNDDESKNADCEGDCGQAERDINQSGDENPDKDPDYTDGQLFPQPGMSSSRNSSTDYLPSHDTHLFHPSSTHEPQQQQPNQEDQQELHLLVKLAIALIKPHFNSKISFSNYENYLRRLIDTNWVELEKCPSPLTVPFVSPDGIELTRNLNLRDLPLSDKIDIFSALCDYRLWCEDAPELLKDYPLDELRLESIGKDSKGFEYWYFSGTRLYRENIELSGDLIGRKKRIKELEFKLIEHERDGILREQENKRRAELERAKQLADEAREARLAAKRQQEQEAAAASSARKRKKTSITPSLPARTGLRERRSSATGNNGEQQSTPTRTLRSRTKPREQTEEVTPVSSQKATRSSAKNSRHSEQSEKTKAPTPELLKKSPEEECREELERISIKQEERADAWCVVCDSLEEWESFTSKFEKTKSINEKYLSNHVNNVLLPHIQGIYAKRAAEIRRKERELMFSLASRRQSTRISSKRAQEEEEERQAQIREAEIQKKKAEAEIRLRAELEREMKARKNELAMNGGASSACSQDGDETAGRYNLRQNHQDSQDDDMLEFDGIVHPDRLAEFYEALELIVDTVRTSKHAWPFVNPVPDTTRGYYDMIDKPMDLKTLRTKVEFRHYKSLIELERDFQLMVNNCERFNGPRNTYTKMAYKLWKSFRKNVQLYLQRDLHMDEQETFVYPPAPPVVPAPPPPEPVTTESVDLLQSQITQNGLSNEGQVEHDKQEDNAHDHSNNHQEEMISNGRNHVNHVSSVGNEIQTSVKVEEPQGPETNGAQGNIKSDFNKPEVKTSPYNTQVSAPIESKLTLQYEPTPVEMPIHFIGDDECELPPEPIVEEVIIDSYAEPCADDNIYVWKQDNNLVDH